MLFHNTCENIEFTNGGFISISNMKTNEFQDFSTENDLNDHDDSTDISFRRLSVHDKLSIKGKLFELGKKLSILESQKKIDENMSTMFKPKISSYKLTDRANDFMGNVQKSELMRKQRLEMMKTNLEREERQDLTFSPVVNKNIVLNDKRPVSYVFYLDYDLSLKANVTLFRQSSDSSSQLRNIVRNNAIEFVKQLNMTQKVVVSSTLSCFLRTIPLSHRIRAQTSSCIKTPATAKSACEFSRSKFNVHSNST